MRASAPLAFVHRYLAVSPLQRAALAVGAAVAALADPARGDCVALLGEATGARALARLRDGMRGSADGAWVLAHRPLIAGARFTPAALAAAHAPGTLGGAYGAFLAAHGFAADERARVALVADAELAYVLTRYRQVHDFWHVLAGLPPTVLGEVALKWFEAAHLRLPAAVLAAAAGPARLTARDAAALRADLVPWALRAAARARPLLAARYELLLDAPLADARAALGFEPAPEKYAETYAEARAALGVQPAPERDAAAAAP